MQQNTLAIISDIKINIADLIKDANNNGDCKGYAIVFGNFSINVPGEDQEEFFEELEELQKDNNVYFSVSDYNDLVMETEEFNGDEF